MNKAERGQHWEKGLRRAQQEQAPGVQGLISVEERRIDRNYKRDQKLAETDKAHARLIVKSWKAADVEKSTLMAEQQRKNAVYEQQGTGSM